MIEGGTSILPPRQSIQLCQCTNHQSENSALPWSGEAVEPFQTKHVEVLGIAALLEPLLGT